MAGRNEISQLNIPDILQRTPSAELVATTKDVRKQTSTTKPPRLINHNIDIFRRRLNRTCPRGYGANTYFASTLSEYTCTARLMERGKVLASRTVSVKAIEEVMDLEALVLSVAEALVIEAKGGNDRQLQLW